MTFSSGSVDALINGIPSYALDQRSCAFEICNNDLNTLKQPLKNDRKHFLSAYQIPIGLLKKFLMALVGTTLKLTFLKIANL